LTHGEVLTLVHDFGHPPHRFGSQVRLRSLAGTIVYRDVGDRPPHVMRIGAYEKDSRDLCGRHYETGEPMPTELAEKLKASSKFLAGYMSARQLTFGYLDMAYHTTDPENIENVAEFENRVTEELRVLPHVEDTNFSCG